MLTTCLDGCVGGFGGMEIKTKPNPSIAEVGVWAELGNYNHIGAYLFPLPAHLIKYSRLVRVNTFYDS